MVAGKVYGFQLEYDTSCDCCQKAKAFKIINRTATRTAGDVRLLDAAIFGQYPTSLIDESRVYLTIPDGYSLFVTVGLLPNVVWLLVR